MGLGTVTNVAQDMRATSAPLDAAGDSTAGKRSHEIPEDDFSVAAIRNLQIAEYPGNIRNNGNGITATYDQLKQFAARFRDSLDRYRQWYKEMSEKIAVGRFSPSHLRNQIEKLEEATERPSGNYTDKNDSTKFWTQEEFKSASRGATDTRALAWLKGEARGAMLSQKGIEPDRVLSLLQDI